MYKKLLFIGATSIILAACGNSSSSEKEESTSPDVEETQNNNEVNKQSDSKDDNEVMDGPLTIPGQWTTDEEGTKVTLEKIITPEKLIDLDPIYMTIHDIKLLKRENDDGILNTIQIDYSAENISDKEIMFRGIETVTTNTKQQLKPDIDDLYGGFNDSEYFGKVENEGVVILPYEEDSFDDLKNIKLFTHDVWNNKQADKFHEAVVEEFDFK